MSETDHYTGKLTRVPHPTGQTLEQVAEGVCKGLGLELSSYNHTWIDELQDSTEYYVVTESAIFSVQRKRHDEGEDIFDAEVQEDGTIDFTVKYYNGGCGFTEAIEAALDNLKE